ncbi:MAG: tetratricopeptide repeat protein [Verrucomicrobia bacterium]|nr:tetratricopeptide repeat protein [Verrucomicrobiota bacterium]
MKLRCSFSSRQPHFVASFALFWLLSLDFGALALDRLTTKDGKTQEVQILGVNGSTVQIRVGTGSIGLPLSSVASVVMAAPAELAAANAAFQANDYAKALPLAKAVAEKYKGLPTDWARQATSLVGDTQVGLGNLKEAEAAYKEYQRVYPGAGTLQTDVGMARIALARKSFDEAKAKLAPIAAAALKEKMQPPALAPAYSQTFFLLGQIAEAQGELEVALENYLRTVTLFYEDRSAVAAAQEKANALRKKDPTLTVP